MGFGLAKDRISTARGNSLYIEHASLGVEITELLVCCCSFDLFFFLTLTACGLFSCCTFVTSSSPLPSIPSVTRAGLDLCLLGSVTGRSLVMHACVIRDSTALPDRQTVPLCTQLVSCLSEKELNSCAPSTALSHALLLHMHAHVTQANIFPLTAPFFPQSLRRSCRPTSRWPAPGPQRLTGRHRYRQDPGTAGEARKRAHRSKSC